MAERRFPPPWTNGRVSAVNYLGPTGGLLSLNEQCAFAVEQCTPKPEEATMSDPYIKAVLTVIAVSLVALVIQNVIRASRADNEVQKVQICDLKNCADVMQFYIGPARYGLAVVPTH
jgi:hypothetical protein